MENIGWRQNDYDRIYAALDGQQHFPFILVAGPSDIGKRALVLRAVQEILGPHQHTDLLHIRDLSHHIGKKHTLTVNQPKSETSATYKLPNGSIYQNIGSREIRDRLVRSSYGDTKIVYIEHIERANIAAANALLKHLEEPLPGRYIIATTSSLDNVMMTLRSRALVIPIQSMTSAELAKQLREIHHLTHDQADVLAYLSAGKPGRAQDLVSSDYQKLIQDRETLEEYINENKLIPLLQLFKSWDSRQRSIYTDAMIQKSIDTSQYHRVDAFIRYDSYRSSNIQADNALLQLAIDIIHPDLDR